MAGHVTEREVIFTSADVELHGTLLLPAGDGPHPALTFLHGSGPSTRAGARAYAEEFARLGIASLFFDKRGCGASGGSWMHSSLDDLAEDARAAARHLKAQSEIDAARVGFWGISQAGWYAPLAADEASFMILISGGGATPRESERFSYESAFERAGLPVAERAEARGVVDAYLRYLATGEGREELAVRLEDGRGSGWHELAPLDRILPSDENRSSWSWVASFDPSASIAAVRCPILLLFGELDTDHPTAIAVERWRAGLREAGNDSATIVVFPGAGHGIRMREGHAGPGAAPFADGYREVMLDWLQRHVVSRH